MSKKKKTAGIGGGPMAAGTTGAQSSASNYPHNTTENPDSQPTTVIKDTSGDRSYFVMTPQLVWALSRDPYDYTLWNVVKMIAREQGECYLTTEDLATMAMMSVGKVSECRRYLLEQGLLAGEIRRDPGYPQPVWHLRIPNLWKRNGQLIDILGDSIRGRIEFKQEKKSLHQVKPSPGEDPPSPGEDPPSPGEGINKQNKKQQQRQTVVVAQLLAEFGMAEPTLTKVLKLMPAEETVKAWIEYVREQDGIVKPIGYVAARLLAGDIPPTLATEDTPSKGGRRNGKRGWLTEDEKTEMTPEVTPAQRAAAQALIDKAGGKYAGAS